jgi:hypothetical protein
MGPLVRPLNRHNHHSEVILCVPERRRFITWHGGGTAVPRGPTHNRLRSRDQERPSREAVDHRADRT